MRRIVLLLFLLAPMVAGAAPVVALEISGAARTSGSTFRLLEAGMTRVSDPVDLTFEDTPGPVTVSFANVVPGDYFGQISFGGEFWEEIPGLIVHPVAGTLSFVHDPGEVVSVSYRLVNYLESCAEITIRNTGDVPLTGIAATLTGADFSVDSTAMATSLDPGETTTVTVCFTGTDLLEHLATLRVTSNIDPVELSFVGDNDPGLVQVAPTITVFTARAPFEASIGPAIAIDGFSGSAPLLPVTTLNGGVVSGGKWNDIARDPEPSTVWAIPDGTTGWGGAWDLTVGGTGEAWPLKSISAEETSSRCRDTCPVVPSRGSSSASPPTNRSSPSGCGSSIPLGTR